jgi:hypothetical protein
MSYALRWAIPWQETSCIIQIFNARGAGSAFCWTLYLWIQKGRYGQGDTSFAPSDLSDWSSRNVQDTFAIRIAMCDTTLLGRSAWHSSPAWETVRSIDILLFPEDFEPTSPNVTRDVTSDS